MKTTKWLFVSLLLSLAAIPVSLHALGAELVTPTSVQSATAIQGTDYGPDLYPAINLINGSGLSATPDIHNFITVTHSAASSSAAWVTDDRDPFLNDFFSDSDPDPSPVLEFTFSQVEHLTDMVIWGYYFGSAESPTARDNEAWTFDIEFSTDGGVTYSEPTFARSIDVGASNALRIPFPPARANAVRVRVTDNHSGHTGSGGDRVGLGEVRFIAHPIPATDDGNFGSIEIADSYVEQRFVIHNPGNVAIPLGSEPRAFISGTDAAQFSLVRDLPAEAPAFGYVYATVRYDPSLVGAHTAALELTNFPTIDFALTGTGVDSLTTTISTPDTEFVFAGILAGNLHLDGNAPDGGAIGTVIKLTDNAVVQGNLTITGGTLDLNGFQLTVTGSLIHNGYLAGTGEVGRIDMAAGSTLQVNQNYQHIGGPIIVDSSNDSLLIIEGNYQAAPQGTGHTLISGNTPALNMFVRGDLSADVTDHISWGAMAKLDVGGDITLASTNGSSLSAGSNLEYLGGELVMSGDFMQTITMEDINGNDPLGNSPYNKSALRLSQLNPMVEFAQIFPRMRFAAEGSTRLSTVPGVTIACYQSLILAYSLVCINGDLVDFPGSVINPHFAMDGSDLRVMGNIIQNHTTLSLYHAITDDRLVPITVPIHIDMRLEVQGNLEQGHCVDFGAGNNYTLVHGDTTLGASYKNNTLSGTIEYKGDVTLRDISPHDPYRTIFSGSGSQAAVFGKYLAHAEDFIFNE
ncbi:MAG: hypothetical protein ACSHYA_17480 [Opitutaceae bacterium]